MKTPVPIPMKKNNRMVIHINSYLKTKTLYLLSILLLGGVISADDQLIWQLGNKNNSESDFSPYYNAWEYGLAPKIQKSPAMDHKTHTFNYAIKENKVISNPEVVSGLATESEQKWMNSNEIVSGLKLSWNETTAGNRRLVLNVVNWANPLKGKDGVEIILPNGGKKIMDLPGALG